MSVIGPVSGAGSVRRSIRDGLAAIGSCLVVMNGMQSFFVEPVQGEKLQEKLLLLMLQCLIKNGIRFIHYSLMSG